MADPANMQIVKVVTLPQGATGILSADRHFPSVAVTSTDDSADHHRRGDVRRLHRSSCGGRQEDRQRASSHLRQVHSNEHCCVPGLGMAVKQTLTTGPLPDMIKFKHDCT
eukprot:2844228-Rhodomonas_salina.2